MKTKSIKTAGQCLRLKGYDVESYGEKHRASRGLFTSDWVNSLEKLLDLVIETEKYWMGQR